MKTEYEIQLLRDKRLKLWEDTKRFLEDRTDENEQISDKDAREFERREKQMKELTNAIDLHSRCSSTENQFNKLTAEYTVGKVKTHPLDNPFSGNVAGGNRMYQTSDEYRQHFINAIRGNFRNDAADYLREGLDSQGGYLLPSEFHDEIIAELTQKNLMRQIATVIQTQSQHKLEIVTTRPAANWINEGQEISLSNETFGQVTLDAYKLAVGVKVSNELLQDSFYNLENHFVEEFGRAIGNAEEDAFINGGGNNGVTKQPEGFLTTLNNAGTDTAITTVGARKPDFDDVFELVYSLPRAYRQNASFLMHDSTLAILRRLKSDFSYYWQASTAEGEPSRLAGYPVYTSSFFPAGEESGTVSMAFGDFSKFIIADRAVRTFKPLRELYALNDLSAFLMIERVDGRLVDKAAIKLLKIK